MRVLFVALMLALFTVVVPVKLSAQAGLKVAGRNVQFHSFGSQGFMYSNQNNYLTTRSSEGTLR